MYCIENCAVSLRKKIKTTNHIKRLVCVLLMSALLSALSMPFNIIDAVSAPSRVINVVYDDSGSMYRTDEGNDVDTWCQAKYSMEVFAAMLGDKDILNIYYMSDYRNSTERDPRIVLHGKDGAAKNVSKLHNEKTRAGNTPFNSVKKAYTDLLKDNADEKWLVVLTDGAFEDGRLSKGEIDSFFASKSPDINIMFLAMGPDAEGITPKEAQNIYYIEAKTNNQILNQITGICTRIFESDRLDINESSKRFSFDVPMGELIVFAQGANVQINGVKKADGTLVKSAKTPVEVKYSECDATNYKNEPARDLVGRIATFIDDFSAGDYSVDVTGAELIKNELMNYGGVPDEDIPKYNIMFYKSYYGLRANDLSKFAPPEKSATYNRSSGEYFKAYYELVQSIHPESHRSRGISPHIDRWWHIITKMPDLDDDNQKKQEYNIYAAFFWAIMRRYIDLYDEGSDVRIYKPNMTRLKMNDDTLIVSNGTECDKFYEVLDAIAIYPELVERILSDVETRTIDDLNDGSPLEEGILLSSLRTFKIAEPGIGADNLPAASIFDIPMLMKKSATPDIYYEADVIEMLKVELEEIKKYLSRFCTVKELPEVMGKLVMEQFDKHMESVALESKVHPSIYRESLFVKTCDTIANALSELGLKKEANKIQEKVDSLR